MVTQAENSPFPPPPVLRKGQQESFITELSWWIGDLHNWQQDLQGAIERGWLINEARVVSLDAGVITAGSIFTQDLIVGAGVPGITLSGTTTRILINDGTQDNIILGNLGAAGTGIQVKNALGAIVFQASDVATFIDGATILNSTIVSGKLVNVDGAKIDDGTITSGKIVSIAYSKVTGVSITNAEIVSVDFSKVTNVSITNSQIVSIAWSKVTSVAVTNAQIVSIAWSKITSINIIGANIQDLTITNSKIGNLTLQTGKHAAAAITDFRWSSQGTTNLTAGVYVTVATISSFATGGYLPFIMYTGNLNNSNGADIRVLRGGIQAHGGRCPDGQNITIAFLDSGATGTHTYQVQIREDSSGSAQQQNNKISGFLLKT